MVVDCQVLGGFAPKLLALIEEVWQPPPFSQKTASVRGIGANCSEEILSSYLLVESGEQLFGFSSPNSGS